MPRPFPALNLCADFHAIAEGEYHPAVRIDRCVIHKPVEQLLIEIHRQLPHFLKPRNESAEKVMLDFPPLLFLFQAVHSALQGGNTIAILPPMPLYQNKQLISIQNNTLRSYLANNCTCMI